MVLNGGSYKVLETLVGLCKRRGNQATGCSWRDHRIENTDNKREEKNKSDKAIFMLDIMIIS